MATENYYAKYVCYGIFLVILPVIFAPVLRAEFIADGVELVQLTDDGQSVALA